MWNFSFNFSGQRKKKKHLSMADILIIAHKQRHALNVWSLMFGLLSLHSFLFCHAFSWITGNPFRSIYCVVFFSFFILHEIRLK